MAQQAYTPSNTGIASFVHASADYDLAPIGIGSMQEQADRLAEFGRNGDIYVVHAAEGETVIPMEVLDSNPQIKEMLFAQMRDMGLNPDEYVVGSELNSINPDTGMPEFFFKSIWKSVKKVFKAVAPIIVPIVGNLILPGIGGILASMAYTKLSGGSWGDTLKAGLMSYAGGAISSGIGNIGDPGGFMSGIESGLAAPFDAASNLSGAFDAGIFGSGATAAASGATAAASGADSTPAGGATAAASGADSTPAGSYNTSGGFKAGAVTPGAGAVTAGAAPNTGLGTIDFNQAGTGSWDPSYEPTMAGETLPDSFYQNTAAPTTVPGAVPTPPPTVNPNPLGFTAGQTTVNTAQQAAIDNAAKAAMAAKDANASYFTLGLDNKLLGGPSIGAADLVAQNSALGLAPSAATKAAAASASPGMLATYGPSAALAGTAAYAFGAFDAPEQEPGETDEEYAARWAEWNRNATYEDNRADYDVADLDPYKYRPAPASVPLVADGGMMYRQPQNMNYGGAAQYPRREMLVEGPGTERSDDIPAMLSDGEFVLNARSVRGADPTGQGNRYRGAQNLYGMMRNFEMKA